MLSLFRPVIVKVGGSLFDLSGQIINVLKNLERPVVIVPGGGIFADLVRKSGSHGTSGHWMAVCGMEQFGWYLSSFGILPRFDLEYNDRRSVILPYGVLRKHDPFIHSWEITSDTIAAWVAMMMNGDLILLKSLDGITKDGQLVEVLLSPITCEEVDPCFLNFVFFNRVSTIIINGRYPERIFAAVMGKACIGTRICPTF